MSDNVELLEPACRSDLLSSMQRLMIIVCASLIVTGCGCTGAERAEPAPAEPAGSAASIEYAWFGLSLEAATEKAASQQVPLVTIAIDGEMVPATADRVPERIRVALQDNRIIFAKIEAGSLVEGVVDPAFVSLIGQPVDAVTAAAGQHGASSVRVVSRDGESLPATRDHRPNRWNLHIRNGVVTGLTFG